MPGYPVSRAERRFGFDELHRAVAAIFRRCRMRPRDASLLAHTLAWADLRGIHSHGVLRVPDYVKKLREEGVDPQGTPRRSGKLAQAFIVDGGNSMGQIGCTFAMKHAIAAARRWGISVAVVRGSNHCGALSYYAMQAAAKGMIGIVTTNALPTMAPWGGKDKIVGINPLAVAFPAGREAPIVLDCAFSQSSHGKIRVFQQMGKPIPRTWAFDRTGRPTADAAKAAAGLLQPIGDHKGVGLGVVFGLLSTALADASYGTDLGNMTDGPRPGRDGHVLIAIDVRRFTTLAEFTRRLDRAVRQIRTSRPTKAGGKLYAPGGLEAETEREYRRRGIPLNRKTIAGINAAAAAVGAPPLVPPRRPQ